MKTSFDFSLSFHVLLTSKIRWLTNDFYKKSPKFSLQLRNQVSTIFSKTINFSKIYLNKKKLLFKFSTKYFFILLSKQAFTLLKDSQLFPMIIWNFSITFSILSMIIFLSVFLLISCTIFYNVTKCNYKYTSGRKKPIVIKLRP